MNGLLLLTGTVLSPDDVAEAERLAQAFVGEGTQVVSRLRTATPLQVNLQVRIAEVSRGFAKSIGMNILGAGKNFFIQQGRDAVTYNPSDGSYTFDAKGTGTTLGLFDKLLGVNVEAALDLAENDGYITTLANPNLTALSGETASFLAGGEIPIPLAQEDNRVSVEFKQYGVSLAFTPTVLADGRISMRVRPEVSELSNTGAVKIGGFEIPGITTRRAETTVELGSGQSFMIAGLLSNDAESTLDKAPFLGDLPILGALFRSKSFKRSETELMIIVTPYLVKPVSASQIALPTDGFRAPNDVEGILQGQTFKGDSGATRPMPSAGVPKMVQPGMTPYDPAAALPTGGYPVPDPSAPSLEKMAMAPVKRDNTKKTEAGAAPGFSFD